MSTTQKRSSSGCLVFAITFFFGAIIFLIFLFGLGFLISGVYYARQSIRMQNSGVQTQASVVTAVSTKCGKNTYGYTYTVRFTDQRGQAQTATLDCLSSKADRGAAITIVYLPDDPTFIELPSQVGSSPIDNGVIILVSFFVCLLGLGGFISTAEPGWQQCSRDSRAGHHEHESVRQGGPRLSERNRPQCRERGARHQT